ncbi:MAG: hypothetical protein NZ805_09805 [Armatimonadetes bacterium]|nr:hypothetical protein [Armatimonadota bacterium]MDW8028930.1 hypothetical protein [Armatimonadota bacterium]
MIAEGKSRIFLIHRILPNMQILAFDEDEFQPPFQTIGETFMTTRTNSWDSEKIGGGTPPLKTKYGWLQIYHGVGIWKGKRAYRLGVVLSALDNPKRFIFRSPEPILEPGDEDETEEEAHYQRNGWVPNVVFTCGAVPRYKNSDELLEEDDEILVYYGVADEVLCVATATIGELLSGSGRLNRFSGNPILKPRSEASIFENGQEIRWERLVYNSGAIRLHGMVYLFYRALGYDGISRIGLALSSNGFSIEGRYTYPVFGPKEKYERPINEEERRKKQLKDYKMSREIGGTEDPRITLIGDNLYMTYTAYGDTFRLALATMKLKEFLKATKECRSYEDWENRWQRLGVLFPWEDKDGFLFKG